MSTEANYPPSVMTNICNWIRSWLLQYYELSTNQTDLCSKYVIVLMPACLNRTPVVCVCVTSARLHSVFLTFWGVFKWQCSCACVSASSPSSVVCNVWFSPHFNIPVPLYCFSIVWMTSVFCYRWTSACLWTVLIRLVLHVLACQHVNVCLHDHGLPTS